MGEHRTNGVALANAVPKQQARVCDLGESVGLLGLSLEPVRDDQGNFCIGVMGTGGRISDLYPMQPRKVLIAVIQTPPIEQIRALLLGEELPTEPPPPVAA